MEYGMHVGEVMIAVRDGVWDMEYASRRDVPVRLLGDMASL